MKRFGTALISRDLKDLDVDFFMSDIFINFWFYLEIWRRKKRSKEMWKDKEYQFHYRPDDAVICFIIFNKFIDKNCCYPSHTGILNPDSCRRYQTFQSKHSLLGFLQNIMFIIHEFSTKMMMKIEGIRKWYIWRCGHGPIDSFSVLPL